MFWVAITIIVLGKYYTNLQKEKLKLENGDGTNSKQLRIEIGNLMAENEEIKERLRNIEYLLSEGNDQMNIDLEYEKEQIRLDKENKFKF